MIDENAIIPNKPVSTEAVVITTANITDSETISNFSIDDFCDNPFIDYVFVPKLLSKSKSELFQNHEEDFTIVKTDKIIGDSIIPFLILTHKEYIVEVWTSKEEDFYLRNNMIVYNTKLKLKFDIVLGQNLGETLEIISAYQPIQSKDNLNDYYIIGEERVIHFVFEDDKLDKISIQIGT